MRWKSCSRTLWIDAVCINQGDLDERAQQVAMMGMIYWNARMNLIYLGEGSPDTTAAMRDIRTLHAEMLRDEQYMKLTREEKDELFWSRAQGSSLESDVSVARLRDCFFTLPWFR